MNELQGKRILFFVPESNIQTNAVHASQVGGLAKYVASLGAEVLVFQAATTIVEREYDLGPHVHVLNDTFPRKKVWFFNVPKLYRDICGYYEDRLIAFRPTHIYTRNHTTCYGARELANKTGAKLIFSVRGPAAEERRRGGGLKSRIASIVMKWQEDYAMRLCDILSTLSYAYEKYLTKTYGREVVGVIPCCTTEPFFKRITADRRNELRRELGFVDDDRVIVWSGSYAHWQCLDKLAVLMKCICSKDSKYKILFLLKKVDEMAALCERIGFDRAFWRMRSCKPDQVAEYLNCADVGINLQDPRTLHSRTCSPIKIAEYLAAGLPVLISGVMGDMPKIIEREHVGRVLPDDLAPGVVLQQLEELKGFDREFAASVSRRLFLWDGNRSEIVKLFSA